MPLFEYKCPRCGRFEILQKFSDPSLMACPTCGKEVHRLLSAPAIQFKGSGWYITDYARKSAGGDSAADGSSSSNNSKETKETKPAKEAKGSKDTSSSSPASTTSKDGSASGSSPAK